MSATYDVLSTHEVRATYKGTSRRPCRFMTSLCPDRCNHSKDVALFAVDEYIAYTKDGQYGDEKQDTIHFAIPSGDADGDRGSDNQPQTFVPLIKSLNPGDKVIIRYEHRYMNDAGGRWPVRPFTKLERIA